MIQEVNIKLRISFIFLGIKGDAKKCKRESQIRFKNFNK